MDVLAGYGSDSSSSSSSSSGAPPEVPKEAKAAEESIPPNKRRRRWDSTPNNGTALPPPSLSSHPSMIEWEVDYLSNHPSKNYPMEESKRRGLEERWNEVDTSTAKALGKQLRQRHEFHNPRFLENAAAACGISDPLGSNRDADALVLFQDYEFKLLELEEAAHNKMYEQIQQEHEEHQAISQFSTDQLERALQQQCHR